MVQCPGCSSTKKIQFILSVHKNFNLYHCDACDLQFFWPLVNAEARTGAYPWYNDPNLVEGIMPFLQYGPRQFLRDMPAAKGELLEVGCSWGYFLHDASCAGYSVTGIDTDSGAIELARQTYQLRDVWPLTLEDFLAQRPDTQFDVVVLFETLEHLDKPGDLLRLVWQRLRPGGYVALSVPNREQHRFLRPVTDCPLAGHLTRWNTSSLRSILTTCGFSIVKMQTEPRASFPNVSWTGEINNRLGISSLGYRIVMAIYGRKTKAGQGLLSQGPSVKRIVARIGVRTYFKMFLPIIGVVTFPLWLLARRGGHDIYTLAQKPAVVSDKPLTPN